MGLRRDHHAKRAAFANLAPHHNGSLVSFDNPFRNRQTETRAAFAAASRLVDPVKAIKDLTMMTFGYTNTLVGYLENDTASFAPRARHDGALTL